MNFRVGELVGWRHELPDYHVKVKFHGRGPFELKDLYRDQLGGSPANQTCESTCIASKCLQRDQERHCLYLVLRTKVGLVELSANQFMSLR